MHNSFELHKALSRLCPGDHKHEVTQGSTRLSLPDGQSTSVTKTRFAGWYTPEFCTAVIRALETELLTPLAQRRRHQSQRSFSTYPTITVDPNQMNFALGRYDCPHCSKKYKYHDSLMRHTEHVHRILRPHKHRKLEQQRQVADVRERSRREKENNLPSGSASSSTPISIPPSSTSAPLMDIHQPATDELARSHGFDNADVWRQRTLESTALGQDRISALPHESFMPLPALPEPAQSIPTASTPPIPVPPVPNQMS